MPIDLNAINTKQKVLADMKVQLKSEFFGLDAEIDKITDSIYAWHVFPELITRPVIVNLWGMTGNGKTSVVRRIAQLLNFFDRFVEIQMDGVSGGSGYYQSSIAAILGDSSIEEGKPGILLLDELQRFRTIDEAGHEAKVSRFQDVWMLLSDGKFASDSTIFREVEDILAQQEWHTDRKNSGLCDDEDDDEEPRKPAKFSFSPYEAQRFKRLLRLPDSLQEIMLWNIGRINSELMSIRTRMTSWEIDYTKLLIFVSGNLDDVFSGSGATEDCDTDADIYHDLTKKISLSDVKSSLADRFRPEQVARLGNNHIIYPSLSKSSYSSLIKRTCSNYVKEMKDISGLDITLDPEIYQEIYENSVYPTQGTRPVFSSVHKIFSSALSNIAVWALENDLVELHLTLDAANQMLIGTSGSKSFNFPVELDLRSRRKKTTIDFTTMVAVHEAGHALIYALLFKKAPLEVKINVVSFIGGYNVFDWRDVHTREQISDQITVCLAGSAAEEMVFGLEKKTNGCQKDIQTATRKASAYIREFGFDDLKSYIAGEDGPNTRHNTNLEGTNRRLDDMCLSGYTLASALLRQHHDAFVHLVTALLERKKLDPKEFKELMYQYVDVSLDDVETNYHTLWENYCSHDQAH